MLVITGKIDTKNMFFWLFVSIGLLHCCHFDETKFEKYAYCGFRVCLSCELRSLFRR